MDTGRQPETSTAISLSLVVCFFRFLSVFLMGGRRLSVVFSREYHNHKAVESWAEFTRLPVRTTFKMKLNMYIILENCHL